MQNQQDRHITEPELNGNNETFASFREKERNDFDSFLSMSDNSNIKGTRAQSHQKQQQSASK